MAGGFGSVIAMARRRIGGSSPLRPAEMLMYSCPRYVLPSTKPQFMRRASLLPLRRCSSSSGSRGAPYSVYHRGVA